MKRKIINIERSPFNSVYFIALECGHQVIRKRSVCTDKLDCPECWQIEENKKRMAKCKQDIEY